MIICKSNEKLKNQLFMFLSNGQAFDHVDPLILFSPPPVILISQTNYSFTFSHGDMTQEQQYFLQKVTKAFNYWSLFISLEFMNYIDS